MIKKPNILEYQNRIPEAVATLRDWCEANEGDNYPRVLLANLYLRNQHLERGREIMDDVAASEPHNEWLPLLRLIYYRNKNDVDNYDKTLAAVAVDTVCPWNKR